jgi:hypothetical protein
VTGKARDASNQTILIIDKTRGVCVCYNVAEEVRLSSTAMNATSNSRIFKPKKGYNKNSIDDLQISIRFCSVV